MTRHSTSETSSNGSAIRIESPAPYSTLQNQRKQVLRQCFAALAMRQLPPVIPPLNSLRDPTEEFVPTLHVSEGLRP